MRLALFLAALAATAPALAQSQAPQVAIARPFGGEVNDHFDDASKTSGGVLAGLRVAVAGSAAFDPSNVLVAAPPPSGSIICVRGVSRDGLYWTRTPYTLEAGGTGQGAVRLQPFAKQEYERHLRAYAREDVALVAFTASDETCFEEHGLFLPELPASGGAEELQLLVNSGSRRTKVELALEGTAGGGPVQGSCAKVQHERIAFDTRCRVAFGPLTVPAVGVLRISLDDGLSPVTKSYRVQLRQMP
ncbi:hypothetical protein [Cribrihabitans pelagius]|uniref:hypothetical protein n=1 Tax=Cribrihabitans pelagius TaxID=1765746 RepID=UPI003B58CB9A